MHINVPPQTVRVQVLSPEAKIPEKAHATDACFDITAASRTYDRILNVTIYGTTMANSVAVIDPGYRGELHVILTGNATDRGANGLGSTGL